MTIRVLSVFVVQTEAVAEFIRNYSKDTHQSTVRGQQINLSLEAIRDAFHLPAGVENNAGVSSKHTPEQYCQEDGRDIINSAPDSQIIPLGTDTVQIGIVHLVPETHYSHRINLANYDIEGKSDERIRIAVAELLTEVEREVRQAGSVYFRVLHKIFVGAGGDVPR
ncbi:hypothetical protein R1sor_000740 [Riccia sorocarpa]|uniref:Uncharacterized protein n=1 Tax=Riccia sorocarpa TaxID=122646 RepID=A0ABD3GUT8_9MARC